LAFALRVWDLDACSLWFDEAVEYWSADAPLSALPRTVLISYQPPLYTYLLHLWLQFDIEPVWLRFLSVALSMLTVAGMIAWARGLFGLRGALIAGAITAVSPPGVRYAQEVGEYALMMCALTLTLNALDHALRNPRWKYWGLWGVLSVASVYSHYGASIIVVSLAVLSFLENLWRKRNLALLRQSVVAATSLILGAPLLVYFLPQQAARLTTGSFVAPSLSVSEAQRLVGSIGDTFLFQLTSWPVSSLPRWPGQIVVALVFALSLLVLVNPLTKMQRRPFLWLLIAHLFYFLAIRSGLYGYGNFGSRYALILAPLFLLAVTGVAEQLVRWRVGFISLALLSVIIGLGVYSLPNRTALQLTGNERFRLEVQEDMREVAQFWMEHRDSDQPTYVYYGAAPAFRYYLRLYGLDTGPLPPTWLSACWRQETAEACSKDNIFYGEWFRSRSLEEKLASIHETVGRPERLWLIFSHTYSEEDGEIIEGLLEQQYVLARSYERLGASAHLLERQFETSSGDAIIESAYAAHKLCP